MYQKMRKTCLQIATIALLALSSRVAISQSKLPQLGKSPIEDVIAAMTLEEKAELVVGNGFYLPGRASKTEPRSEQKKVPGVAGTTRAIPRLGITSLAMSDGPSGLDVYYMGKNRNYYATAWPSPTLLGSSWDEALAQQVGKAFGTEVKEYGVDIILGPGMNIHRNPLGGRNFEYYSEDPLITGNMAAAMIQGIQSNGVGTSPKHFAANNQETNRMKVNTIVSERALREIYLKGFEIATKKAKPWTIMSSYNLINGTYTSESPDLLAEILKKEWGFKGYVMTDWFAGTNPVAQIKAGNVIMPGSELQSKAIIEAVKNGQIEEKTLNAMVSEILTTITLSPSFKGYQYSEKPDLYKNAQISRAAAAEGMVLLKNEHNTLPINSRYQTIAVFGNASYDLIAHGTGGGTVNKPYKISFSEALPRAGFTLEPELEKHYKKYIDSESLKRPKQNFLEAFANPLQPIKEYVLSDSLINYSAMAAGAAIITIGRNAGEGADRKVEDYYLTDFEKTMIKSVSTAFHQQNKKVIVILNIGAVSDVTQWKDDVDAILLAWQPGQEGGNAIVDVMSGSVNPSGKLATTFPASYTDVPSAKNFPGKEISNKSSVSTVMGNSVSSEVIYEEGIYVGYRYYNTFKIKPTYEFGYGLSYTTFNYGPVKLNATSFKGKITATITITNTGKIAGKEVVQLYLSAPKGKLDKPSEELKGFAKTVLLEPGKSQTLTFTLEPKDLASFDTNTSSWIAEAGQYSVKIGASSLDIKSVSSFVLPKELIVEKVHKALAPQVSINELKAK